MARLHQRQSGIGELGAGKTLSLTYLAWHNWLNKSRKLYSNIDLYGIPFVKVNSIPSLDQMQKGFFVADELWLWLDSWGGQSDVKRLISSILLKSRKRELTICYTTQGIDQVTPRIRKVTDLSAYPMIPYDTWCRMLIFKGIKMSESRLVPPPIYFNTESVFAMYNTKEEVKAIEDNSPTNFMEQFIPIEKNEAWKEYCIKYKKMSEIQFIRYSREVQKTINPKNITSESQRDEDEIYDAVPRF